MTTYNPIFRSPIVAPEPVSGSHLQLSDLTGVQITLIQGEARAVLQTDGASVPAKPGEVINMAGGLLACLTLTNFYWFGLTPSAKLPDVVELNQALVKNQSFTHATDFTHGKAVLKISGSAAPELLSKICGLNFSHKTFPNLYAAQTSAAKIKTLIVRCDENSQVTYYLHVDRPLGQYFWEVVGDAGREFGLS
jgi:heterotetrameric sarcosine oxidase gamma subunit